MREFLLMNLYNKFATKEGTATMKVDPPYFCQTDQQNVLLVRNKTENSGDLNDGIRSFNKKKSLIIESSDNSMGFGLQIL